METHQQLEHNRNYHNSNNNNNSGNGNENENNRRCHHLNRKRRSRCRPKLFIHVGDDNNNNIKTDNNSNEEDRNVRHKHSSNRSKSTNNQHKMNNTHRTVDTVTTASTEAMSPSFMSLLPPPPSQNDANDERYDAFQILDSDSENNQSSAPFPSCGDAEDDCFRRGGLTIGRDFLRLDGSTVTRGLLKDDDNSENATINDSHLSADRANTTCLSPREILGKGAFSTVYRAVWKRAPKANALQARGKMHDADPKSTAAANCAGKENRVVPSFLPSSSNHRLSVAVKQCPVQTTSTQRLQQLLIELKTLCQVDCSSLVCLHGAFLKKNGSDEHDNGGNRNIGSHRNIFSDGTPTITMVFEYMDRGSLEDLFSLARQRNMQKSGSGTSNSEKTRNCLNNSGSSMFLPAKMTASIAYQMLTGLAYLHNHVRHRRNRHLSKTEREQHQATPPTVTRRIIHRDVKPANVLVNSTGAVKLCDFGLASLADLTATSRSTALEDVDTDHSILQRTVQGTKIYMAPERLRCQPYGRLSDLWSAGLVLQECCTGLQPFAQCRSLIDLVMTVEEIPMEQLVPTKTLLSLNGSGDGNADDEMSSNKGLLEILTACLQKDPAKRIPAAILLKSPWFSSSHQIENTRDASEQMKNAMEWLSSTPLP